MKAELERDLETVTAALRAATVRVHDGRRGSGSGVVWSADGVVVTNAHVVRSARATVEFADGRRRGASLLKRDAARDLAALRIDQTGLEPAPVRDAATLAPGELVVAVGNPLGLVGALSTGLVQRCNARWVIADVRLAPGNSGGPLADASGRVVGVNSMVAGGLALAVPSNAVLTFLNATPERRRLGVALASVVLPFGTRRARAFLVTEVGAGSVAEAAGLALGDAIVATDRGPVPAGDEAGEALAAAAWLDVVRAGRMIQLTLPWTSLGGTTRAA
ncbi:MAG: S1C family serine protease [Vulcanimicrobiaceae bacterium]